MGKASTNKKVARVARTGGGRTTKGSSTSLFWPVFIGIVVVLGTAGIVYSKDQRQPDTSRPQPAKNGKPQDHWHAAVGMYVCDKFLPNITDQADVAGIHTHGEGVVHIHPFSALAAGKRATLGAFFKSVKATVNSSEIALPGQPVEKSGKKCDGRTALIQTKTWRDRNPDTPGTLVTGDPSGIRPRNGELITIALVSKGADIPRPASADQLGKLTDLANQSPATTLPGADTATPTPESTPPGSTPPESTPPGSTPPESTPPGSTPPPAETPTSPSVP